MKIENSKIENCFFGSSKLVIPIIKRLTKLFLKLVVTTEQRNRCSQHIV
jgi:hypothetical protein